MIPAPPRAREALAAAAAALGAVVDRRARAYDTPVANLDELGSQQLTADDITALFPGAWWHEVFGYMKQPLPPVYYFDRSLAVDSIAAGKGPWAVVVHGDLHATGDLDFWTSDYKTSLLVVHGNVRCRNFRFTNGATCVVAHDLTASGYVLGRYGDETARLEVGGALRARALLLDHVTGVEANEIDAITYSADGWGLPQDVDDTGFIAGELDLHAAWQAAITGAPILRPEVEAELRTSVAERVARERAER